MAVERIIGVDFGTSTSVVRVKRYQNGNPVGDGERLDARSVIFNGTYPTVPTLIQRVGEYAYYGYDAQVPKKNATVYRNFKINLESPDEALRLEARALTQEFLCYLAQAYQAQSESGHLGSADDHERTLISYPVKWSDDTKAFMVEAAKQAGFPNVEGLDEAQAAIHAVTLQSEGYLKQRGYLRDQTPCTMLLIDMGAGTTDLVLCSHTPGPRASNKILATWPTDSCILFGGQEVEKLLRAYVRTKLPEEMADTILKRCGPEKFKTWKETVVSPALRNGQAVDGFSDLDMIAELLGQEAAPYNLTRDTFEAMAREYLLAFPELVKQCLYTAGIHESKVELVILTGGHSQWYFVKEMLAGEKPGLCPALLPQIAGDKGRVIPIARPQETVALGLVYRPLFVDWNSTAPRQPAPPPKTEPAKAAPSPVARPAAASPLLYWPKDYSKRAEELIFVCEGHDAPKISLIDGTGTAVHRGKAFPQWGPQKMVAGGRYGAIVTFLGLDGRVHLMGNDPDLCDAVARWRDITSIACGLTHVVGLKKDGTVVAAGENRKGQCNVADWRGIVQLACGDEHTVGLKKDGTVVAAGEPVACPSQAQGWTQVVSILCGPHYTAGLRQDGSVLHTKRHNITGDAKWRDICMLRNFEDSLCGVRKDGTVAYTGLLATGGLFESEHSVVARHFAQMEKIAGWKDLASAAVGQGHIVGLRQDGTLLAAGIDRKGQCEVKPQGQVVAVLASGDCTVAVTREGRLYYNAWKRKEGLLSDKVLSHDTQCHPGTLFPLPPGTPIPDELISGESAADLDW